MTLIDASNDKLLSKKLRETLPFSQPLFRSNNDCKNHFLGYASDGFRQTVVQSALLKGKGKLKVPGCLKSRLSFLGISVLML